MADSKTKIPPKPQGSQKKKRKSAPDRPQPAWLFPTNEENPILNPKPKSDVAVQQEAQERAKALDYMTRRVHAVPDRPAPPPQLLALIGIFLTNFGFNSTSRIFTSERTARSQLNGWEDAVGKKIEKGTPALEKIYRDWYREWKIAQKDETSSSESDSDAGSDSESEAGVQTMDADKVSSDDDSEASSDGFGNSDVEMEDAPRGNRGKIMKKAPGSSSGSSTSDSDADDEQESMKPKAVATAKKSAPTAISVEAKPTVATMINKLKRKASTSSSQGSESSDSEAEPSKQDKPSQTKKTKTAAATNVKAAVIPKRPVQAAASSSSSESSSSDSDSDAAAPRSSEKPSMTKGKLVSSKRGASSSSSSEDASSTSSDSDVPVKEATIVTKSFLKPPGQTPKFETASSDSSVTINGDSKKPSASVSSASDSSSATSSDVESDTAAPPPKAAVAIPKKKHQGAKPTPLAELSVAATDDHLSNKYQSYDYADKAYKDLSVTRGKGFTKEKNKKKRGSYRGGAIDTSGGKSFKFED